MDTFVRDEAARFSLAIRTGLAKHQQHLSSFVLSLSKYERTRQGLPEISLISLLRQIQGKEVPGLSLRQAQDGTGRTDWKGESSFSAASGRGRGGHMSIRAETALTACPENCLEKSVHRMVWVCTNTAWT
jgi:hypothetical protein